MGAADSLTFFHPLLRRWFTERVGTPTAAQAQAWPAIAEGRHVLVSAPTGSGKTLAAFLWALDQLLRGTWPPGQVRVLYVSPLKALNADVERNLKAPLAELQQVFEDAGEALPEVQVMTRSGDTSQADRRRMIRRPPEILITTPESLNILLTSKGGRRMFGGLTTVILDEIHAVAGSKRGTHLMTAVERLVLLSGEFQRISISATIRPLERIAAFVGGYRLEKWQGQEQGQTTFHRRPVVLVKAKAEKRYELKVRSVASAPTDSAPGEKEPSVWAALAPEFRKIIRTNRSTLLFANSRRLTERVTRLINEEDGGDLAYSHHGSLSREIRSVVEARLKKGQLAAIVATNSLELGIDVGSLDEVLLIQTPPSVASAVQRLGRAGHGVGQISRGRLYPTHPKDFLDAAVVARCVLEQDIEEVRPVECALDVLAQVVVSMVSVESWRLDDLFDQVRGSYAYRQLMRRQFDLVIDMLAGRYAGSRVRELRPRVSIDRVAGTVRGRDGVARLVYLAGGTIPDRGYFNLRLLDTKAKLGELDEEFVWERSVGDTFALGAQSWKVERVTHNDVLVSPSRGSAGLAPFWRADERDRGWHLSEKVLEFLAWADTTLREKDFLPELRRQYAMSPEAGKVLLELLERQREATGCPLPHRQHLVIEHYNDASGGQSRRQVLLHTLWGGEVNRPFAIALAAAWEEKYGTSVEILQSNDCINLVLGEGVSVKDVLGLVHEGNLEKLLRRRLETTGFFGARFRHNASRALLLPRNSFGNRMPLWLNRVRSKKLLEAVSGFEDFPIVLETWRTCLQDEFDLPILLKLLGELRRGEIEVSQVHTSAASPFADDILWKQTNQLMYEDDTPESGGGSKVREDLLKELVFSTQLRPRIARKLVREVEAKLQRIAPGYAPRSAEDLLDWLGERLLIPMAEWGELLSATERDHGLEAMELEAALQERALQVSLPGADEAVVAAQELPRVLEAIGCSVESVTAANLSGAVLAPDRLRDMVGRRALSSEEEAGATLEILLAEWLRAYGPLPQGRLERVFGLQEAHLQDARLQDALASLVEERQVVVDLLTRKAEVLEVCDSENLELLLRVGRARARPRFEPLPLERLPLALAAHQGLASVGESLEDLQQRLEQLFGYPAAVDAWETELLPARMSPFYPAWLDSLLQNSDCLWFGCGNKKVSFAFSEDLALFHPPPDDEPSMAETLERARRIFPDRRGRFSFDDLLEASALGRGELTEELWSLAWAGALSTNSLEPLRRGVAARFTASRRETPPSASSSRPSHRLSHRPGRRRSGGGRWSGPVSEPGLWFTLDVNDEPADALEEEELRRDRARVLLDRYGVLFRELLARELPQLRWGSVFRSLRLMELSGEILAGHFFEGVSGLQFASHTFFRRLGEELPEDAIFWLAAGDPASLCGVDLPELKAQLPARRRGTHLVYHGSRLVLVSEAKGKRLNIRVAADHPELPTYFLFLKGLLSRESHPLRFVEVREINGEKALGSPYEGVLKSLFSSTREAKGWRLRKSYDRRSE